MISFIRVIPDRMSSLYNLNESLNTPIQIDRYITTQIFTVNANKILWMVTDGDRMVKKEDIITRE